MHLWNTYFLHIFIFTRQNYTKYIFSPNLWNCIDFTSFSSLLYIWQNKTKSTLYLQEVSANYFVKILWTLRAMHIYVKSPRSSLLDKEGFFMEMYRATALQRGNAFPSCAWRGHAFPSCAWWGRFLSTIIRSLYCFFVQYMLPLDLSCKEGV